MSNNSPRKYPSGASQLILLGALCFSLFSGAFAQAPKAKEQMDKLRGDISNKDGQVEKDYQWYPDSKFAMFIHWGLYSDPAPWIEATQKPGKTYLFIRDWPRDGRVWLPGLEGKIERASFLLNDQSLSMGQSGNDRFLQVPSISPDPKATVIVLEHGSPISFNAKQWVVSSAHNSLLPIKGVRNGVEYTEKVRWMEIFGDWQHYPILHEWEKKGSSAQWEFHTPEAGQYILEIEYSCDLDSDLREGLIGVDGDMRTFVPVYTGDTWDQPGTDILRPMPRYMTRRIGLINISEKGNHTLKIQLDDEDNGGWIRLSKIRLIPAN